MYRNQLPRVGTKESKLSHIGAEPTREYPFTLLSFVGTASQPPAAGKGEFAALDSSHPHSQWSQQQKNHSQLQSVSGNGAEMGTTTAHGPQYSFGLDSRRHLINPNASGSEVHKEIYDNHGVLANQFAMLPSFLESPIQTGKTGHVYEKTVTLKGETKVLIGNDWITIPEGLELMNPMDCTESVVLDLRDLEAIKFNSFNLRNRACLEEDGKFI